MSLLRYVALSAAIPLLMALTDPTEIPVEARRCATASPTSAELRKTENDRELFKAVNKSFISEKAPIEIRVFFHVFKDGDRGVVPAARIDRQMKVLNDAYRTAGVRFIKEGAATYDEPRFATLSHRSSGERDAKKKYQKDPKYFLNVYIATLGDRLLGWATFPNWLAGDPDLDGVVLLNESLPGGNEVGFNLGQTAVDEVGHWLGLYHTFEGGCTDPNDEVPDTPQEASKATKCPPTTQDTCPTPGADPVKNFMNYVDDACMDQFTQGQIGRMKDLVGAYRPELLGGILREKVNPIRSDR